MKKTISIMLILVLMFVFSGNSIAYTKERGPANKPVNLDDLDDKSKELVDSFKDKKLVCDFTMEDGTRIIEQTSDKKRVYITIPPNQDATVHVYDTTNETMYEYKKAKLINTIDMVQFRKDYGISMKLDPKDNKKIKELAKKADNDPIKLQKELEKSGLKGLKVTPHGNTYEVDMKYDYPSVEMGKMVEEDMVSVQASSTIYPAGSVYSTYPTIVKQKVDEQSKYDSRLERTINTRVYQWRDGYSKVDSSSKYISIGTSVVVAAASCFTVTSVFSGIITAAGILVTAGTIYDPFTWITECAYTFHGERSGWAYDYTVYNDYVIAYYNDDTGKITMGWDELDPGERENFRWDMTSTPDCYFDDTDTILDEAHDIYVGVIQVYGYWNR